MLTDEEDSLIDLCMLHPNTQNWIETIYFQAFKETAACPAQGVSLIFI
jgi:hypothetical protein